jgi:hypothetical protein
MTKSWELLTHALVLGGGFTLGAFLLLLRLNAHLGAVVPISETAFFLSTVSGLAWSRA